MKDMEKTESYMSYEETLVWIHQMEQFGIHLGLTRMENLLERMGRPDRQLKIIHVAGTNGKGSVCTFIASVLQEAGYSVGRYISPTLFEYRERIQMNGQMIEEDMLAKGMSIVRSCCESMAADGQEVPTIFEIETAVGFWYFLEKACDYVVLETGMGGRLDSTNVIEHPILNVITSISMDHMAQLGDTLTAIAGEKAGILKKGTPAVFYPQKSEAMEVLVQTAKERRVPSKTADWNQLKIKERTLCETADTLEAAQIFDYKHYKDLCIHLAGTYQVENACLAVEAMEMLGAEGVTEAHLRLGLEKAKWPGRFQCLSKNPCIYVDGAHNPDGAMRLRESIETYFSDKNIISVMGVFKDKDYTDICKIMSEVSDTLIGFTPDHPRGLESALLCETAGAYFKEVLDGEKAEKALAMAKEKASDAVIIIFGSLSTISKMCELVKTDIKEQQL